MSVDATLWAWKQQGLSPIQKIILLSLADRANDFNMCFPSVNRIMLDTGIGKKDTVFKAIKELEQIGLLAIEKEAGRSNHYQLLNVELRENTSPKNRTTPVPKW